MSAATVSFQDDDARTLGHFRLLEQVGAGAFGAVWKAHDGELDRTVAVKIPRKGELTASETERFLREARAVAQLNHTNICSVYEVGREGDSVYIVSEFVHGATLDDWLKAHRLTFRASAELCAKIAEALHHAHDAGVVHRDLKPSNVMIDAHGEPFVMDFGLAKRDTADATMTVDGRVLGTPAYMSPEQARGEGHHADRRSDVYSLGVILYRLFTGELPFRGSHNMLILQILNEEPPPVRKLDSHVPNKAEVKAVAFAPDGSTILTGSLDGTARLWDATSGASLCRPLLHMGHVWKVCFNHDGTTALTLSEDGNARLWDISRASPRQRALGSLSAAKWSRRICVSSDGSKILSGGHEDVVQRWDVETARPAGPPFHHPGQVSALAFGPDGKTALVGCENGACRLWSIERGEPIGAPMKHNKSVTEVAISPDGQTALTASRNKTARFWDATTGQPLGDALQHPDTVWYATFSHDGATAATACADGIVRLWDVATRRRIGLNLKHAGTVWVAKFSADDRLLLTGTGPSSGSQGTGMLWDLTTYKTVCGPLRHRGSVASVDFCPNRDLILTGGFDGKAQVWSSKTGDPVGEPYSHRDRIWDVAFSGDGGTILTAGDDLSARLWDVATGKPLGPPLLHPAAIHNALFCGENQYVATGCADNTARLWRVPLPMKEDPDRIILRIRFMTRMEMDSSGKITDLDDARIRDLRERLRRSGRTSPGIGQP